MMLLLFTLRICPIHINVSEVLQLLPWSILLVESNVISYIPHMYAIPVWTQISQIKRHPLLRFAL